MGFLTDLIGGAASGGIFGVALSLISTGVKAFAEHKRRKQEFVFKQAEWDKEYKLRELLGAQADQESENERLIVALEARTKGMEVSYKDQISLNTNPTVDSIRALFRPFLTLSLVIVVVIFYFTIADISMKEYIILSTVFSSSTAVLWWFGERAFLPKGLK